MHLNFNAMLELKQRLGLTQDGAADDELRKDAIVCWDFPSRRSSRSLWQNGWLLLGGVAAGGAVLAVALIFL